MTAENAAAAVALRRYWQLQPEHRGCARGGAAPQDGCCCGAGQRAGEVDTAERVLVQPAAPLASFPRRLVLPVATLPAVCVSSKEQEAQASNPSQLWTLLPPSHLAGCPAPTPCPQVGMKCVALAGRQPVYELGAADLVVRDLSQLSFVNLKQLFAAEERVAGQVRSRFPPSRVLGPLAPAAHPHAPARRRRCLPLLVSSRLRQPRAHRGPAAFASCSVAMTRIWSQSWRRTPTVAATSPPRQAGPDMQRVASARFRSSLKLRTTGRYGRQPAQQAHGP